AESVARSKTLLGMYESDPNGPLVTARNHPDHPLQRAGHASIVETAQGQWYMVHLCGRPVTAQGHCILGRETAIQKVTWTEDGWLGLRHGGGLPALEVEAPGTVNEASEGVNAETFHDDFNEESWSVEWSSLREPITEQWASKTARPGWLRLYGRESLYS